MLLCRSQGALDDLSGHRGRPQGHPHHQRGGKRRFCRDAGDVAPVVQWRYDRRMPRADDFLPGSSQTSGTG